MNPKGLFAVLIFWLVLILLMFKPLIVAIAAIIMGFGALTKLVYETASED